MPAQFQTILQTIVYILDEWYQNNVQHITGTIGQNVVWNLAEFIRKNPENWEKSTVVATNSNYTTNDGECIVIFTNNASGTLNFVDTIWNKYYFVNATDNDRDFSNGKFYIDINGDVIETIAARTSVYIAKGEDDNWYEIASAGSGSGGCGCGAIPVIVGDKDAPVGSSSVWQNDELKGLGTLIDGVYRLMIFIAEQPLVNYGNNASFDYDPVAGTIDISPNTFSIGDSVYVNKNQ